MERNVTVKINHGSHSDIREFVGRSPGSPRHTTDFLHLQASGARGGANTDHAPGRGVGGAWTLP